MPGYYAKNTPPDFLWGSNVLENILMKIRDEILTELAESTSAPPAASTAPSKIAISGDYFSKVVAPAIPSTSTSPVTNQKATISGDVSTADS